VHEQWCRKPSASGILRARQKQDEHRAITPDGVQACLHFRTKIKEHQQRF
jgi:hypothetical protein